METIFFKTIVTNIIEKSVPFTSFIITIHSGNINSSQIDWQATSKNNPRIIFLIIVFKLWEFRISKVCFTIIAFKSSRHFIIILLMMSYYYFFKRLDLISIYFFKNHFLPLWKFTLEQFSLNVLYFKRKSVIPQRARLFRSILQECQNINPK